MEKELAALESKDTWELTHLSKNKKAIGSKWGYKTKLNPDGTVDRYKTRFVIALTAIRGWHLCQLDVNNTFFIWFHW